MAEERWNHNIHYHGVILDAVPAGARRALDVGCGEGTLTRQLHQHGVPEVIGIDPHEPSVATAKAHPDARDITYLVGDVLSYPFEPGGFGVVASVAALHHMDARDGLTRLRDLVAPGGVLAIVGLARPDLPADIPREAAGFVAVKAYRLMKPYWEHPSPIVWPPPDRYSTMRRLANDLLPGVRWRRHLLWRYSLVWTKPR
jgi:SAM-dependent methyltransferase